MSQIYALFGVQFTALKIGLAYTNWEIKGISFSKCSQKIHKCILWCLLAKINSEQTMNISQYFQGARWGVGHCYHCQLWRKVDNVSLSIPCWHRPQPHWTRWHAHILVSILKLNHDMIWSSSWEYLRISQTCLLTILTMAREVVFLTLGLLHLGQATTCQGDNCPTGDYHSEAQSTYNYGF